MSAKSSTPTRTRWRTIVRAVAFLFLVLTGIDLTVPRLCGEENAPLFRMHSSALQDDAAQDPQSPALPTEDCFCCCSHVLAAEGHARLTALTLLTVSDTRAWSRIPLPPIRLHFHPPRIA